MTQPLRWTFERHASVASTMDEAKERARAGAPDGTVVVAEEMTAGRGTKGHGWVAPKGGLYLSIILRGLKDPHLLTLALGNAVADALEVAGVEPRLKWVNDVFVDARQGGGQRKVAGILVEAESTGADFEFLVAGIGINVNGHAKDLAGVEDVATTLEDELGCDSCVPDLETLLLDSVGRWLDRVRDGRDAEIVAAFGARDCLKGRTVRVRDGADAVQGVADGIDAEGRLIVRAGGAPRAVLAGSVEVLPGP